MQTTMQASHVLAQNYSRLTHLRNGSKKALLRKRSSSIKSLKNKLASLEATLVRNYDRLTDGGEV